MSKIFYNDNQYAGAVTPQPQMCPIGKIDMYAGSNAPVGWLLCRGQAVNRTAYADLFAVIGTTYGEGDGSTTFNVPDLCDRVPVGAGNNYLLNDSGGSTTHTHTTGDVTLSVNQIPSHNHGSKSLTGWAEVLSNKGHSFNGIMYDNGGNYNGNYLGSGSNAGLCKIGINATHTHDSNGGGQAHNHGDTSDASNMMPYRGINFIIYAGV